MIDVKVGNLDIWKFETKSAVSAVDGVLLHASVLNASDIHIDPRMSGMAVRMRVDGQLEHVGFLPKNIQEEFISRLKILSGARTDVHVIPQDGRFRISLANRDYNIRTSFMPTYYGENAVIRMLPASFSIMDSFASLGFTPEHVSRIGCALKANSGLILVTGPTGSGKTTTLRVCLGLKASEPLSVMTLEDPVEYEVPGVRHVHIRHNYGVTFATALRSSLRQDPDVIMVGEIRDSETATTAVTTALTGHLVLSTLHTTSAIDTILRLNQMGVPGYLIGATIKLIISQRLVRIVCKQCSGTRESCEICRNSGYFGRSVIAEVLPIDSHLSDLISRGESMKKINDYVIKRGFVPMSSDAQEKIDWGVTTNEEIIRAMNS